MTRLSSPPELFLCKRQTAAYIAFRLLNTGNRTLTDLLRDLKKEHGPVLKSSIYQMSKAKKFLIGQHLIVEELEESDGTRGRPGYILKPNQSQLKALEEYSLEWERMIQLRQSIREIWNE